MSSKTVKRARLPVALDLPLSAVLLGLFLGLIWGVSRLLGFASVNIPSWFQQADAAAYRTIAGINNPQFTDFVFLFFNDPGVDYTIVIAACLGYMWVKRRSNVAAAAAAVGLALVVGAWTMPHMQAFGFRPRPFMEITDIVMNEQWRKIWASIPTFPSGHIREVTGLSLVLAYFWPGARWFALAYVSFIAFTRVYLGAHYPSDVLAGVLVGLLSGSFSLLAVDRGKKTLHSLASIAAVRAGYDYVFRSKSGDQAADPLAARAIRSGLVFGLLLLGTYVLGNVVYIRDPRILADYLRNTDNSLVYPVFRQFEPGWAQLVYWLFADGVKTYAALVALILGYGAFRGRDRLGRGAIAVLVAFVAALAVVTVFGGGFERTRPFGTGEVPLPEEWQSRWPGPASFPDSYLVLVMALSWILVRTWPGLRIPAIIYPLLSAVSLLYFGAAWPTDAVATLVAGYWVAEYSLFLTRQFPLQAAEARERSPAATRGSAYKRRGKSR
ncbi:MAG: phosphatase PAP2 family protein [Chloroflexi bacterium]|nr:phosphatase PAP2 family protein [Chloroflexota bacterium]